MFGIKSRKPDYQELMKPIIPPVYNMITHENVLRPCWVLGKKALFHRWANTANPALPRGQEPGENVRYFQYRNTKALVEFEDGSVDLVWPKSVKFADHGLFLGNLWRENGQEAEIR